MQELEEQLRAAEIARAAAAAEAAALGAALQRHHESANTELHLSDRSTRALTTHMKMLQVVLVLLLVLLMVVVVVVVVIMMRTQSHPTSHLTGPAPSAACELRLVTG
jgi:Flp pilus assembly protein TadB